MRYCRPTPALPKGEGALEGLPGSGGNIELGADGFEEAIHLIKAPVDPVETLIHFIQAGVFAATALGTVVKEIVLERYAD